MEISVRIEGEKAVLALSGPLVQGEHLGPFREKVNTLLREGYRELVIDLRSVTYIDSAGLGELVAMHASVQREGTALLRLTGLSKGLADLSVVNKLRGIFDVEPGHAADPSIPDCATSAGNFGSAWH